MGSKTSSEANACFTDDCFLRVPGQDEERKKFDKRLLKAREVKGDHNIKAFKEDMRTLETVMIMCFFKLSLYSFDYKLLVKDLKNEDQTMNEWLGLIRDTVFCNFNVMKQSKISFAIRKAEGETVDGCYDTWSLSFKRLRPTVKTGKASGRRSTEAGSEEQRVFETFDFEEVLQERSEKIRTTFDLRLSIRRQMDEKIQERRRELGRIMMEEDFSEMNRTRPQEKAEFEVVKSAEYSNGKPKNQESAPVENSQSSLNEVINSTNVGIPQSSESDQPTSSNPYWDEDIEEAAYFLGSSQMEFCKLKESVGNSIPTSSNSDRQGRNCSLPLTVSSPTPRPAIVVTAVVVSAVSLVVNALSPLLPQRLYNDTPPYRSTAGATFRTH